MRSALKSELNCDDRSYKMWSIMKRRQDNDVIDHTGVSFIEYDTKLSRSIGQYAGYDEDETKNRFDLSYNYVLLQKQN